MSRTVRALSTLVSSAGQRAKLLTFFVHRVLDKPDPMIPGEMHATQFDEALRWIGDRFRVLRPLEACERLAAPRFMPWDKRALRFKLQALKVLLGH